MSTSDPVSPLVAQSCMLQPPQLRDQLERYRQLGQHTSRLQHESGRLVAQFSEDLPAQLVERTLEIERGCCSFLSIDYDALDRRLTITTDPASHDATLAAIFSALSEKHVPLVKKALQGSQQSPALIATGEHEPGQCCEPAALENCCEPEAKDTCCGSAATSAPTRCGCKS